MLSQQEQHKSQAGQQVEGDQYRPGYRQPVHHAPTRPDMLRAPVVRERGCDDEGEVHINDLGIGSRMAIGYLAESGRRDIDTHRGEPPTEPSHADGLTAKAHGTRPGCHSFRTLVRLGRTCPENQIYVLGRDTGPIIGT